MFSFLNVVTERERSERERNNKLRGKIARYRRAFRSYRTRSRVRASLSPERISTERVSVRKFPCRRKYTSEKFTFRVRVSGSAMRRVHVSRVNTGIVRGRPVTVSMEQRRREETFDERTRRQMETNPSLPVALSMNSLFSYRFS